MATGTPQPIDVPGEVIYQRAYVNFSFQHPDGSQLHLYAKGGWADDTTPLGADDEVLSGQAWLNFIDDMVTFEDFSAEDARFQPPSEDTASLFYVGLYGNPIMGRRVAELSIFLNDVENSFWYTLRTRTGEIISELTQAERIQVPDNAVVVSQKRRAG